MAEGPVIIPGGTTTNTGVMRGRDVREKLNGMLHPKAIEVIATVAEINHTNTLAIAELAGMQEKFLDMLQGFTDIAGNMKERTDQLVRATGQAKEASEGNEDV